jgi:AAA domain
VTVVEFDPDAYARAQGEEPPPDVARPARRIYRLSELANLKSAAEDAVIAGGIMTRGGKVMVHAGSGVGKTTLLDHMLAALASGCPFLGRFRVDRPRRVLGIQGELAESELASHGQALLATFDGTPAAEGLTFWLETQLRLPSGYAELRAVVRDVGAEIVAIDPFLEFFEGESSDKPEQVGKLFAALDQLMRDEPTVEGIVVSHHSNVTQQRTAGSWKFEGWPSTILRLEKVPGVPTDRMLCFEKIRAPGFGLPEKLQIRLSDAGYLPIAEDEPSRTAGELTVVMVLREAGGQLRRQELVERVQRRGSVKLRAAVGYIGKAKQAGLIEATQDGREVIYRVTEEAAP